MHSIDSKLQSSLALGREVARTLLVGENLGRIRPSAFSSHDNGDWSQ